MSQVSHDIALKIGPISPAVHLPLYQQIIDGFKRAISDGDLTGGEALPSFRRLAEDLLVSVITVRRAYEELEREGIIYRRQGLGTFVAEGGDLRSRESKRERARNLIEAAVYEALESGMSDEQARNFISDITQQSLSKESPWTKNSQ